MRARAAASYCATKKGIWVGMMHAFRGIVAPSLAEHKHPFDDAIFVSARDGHAVVAGVNARSVVFAAYRYLEELGCRWLRPGKDGERVPRRANPLAKSTLLQEAPSYRHRCICIEGSCSEEHVRSMIDYAAKRGFNAYFLQFRSSHAFFSRWYAVERHRGSKTTPFSPEEASAICERLKEEMRKRGMIIHRVGHGWTCEPLGIAGNDWTPTDQPPPASKRRFFAEIGGERQLFRSVALNTQLCYSNPRVRTIMARAVAEYAETHPDEEVVHVWLADGSNNFCECAACRKRRPSDFYVMILNEIDRLLSRKNLPTRIVFLAYVDLLWAPTRQRIRNQDRFILMFAPITRSYSSPFLEDRSQPEKVGRYLRNRLQFPRSPRANLELLEGWRSHFKGDCVDFDYHLWSDHANDPGQMALAQVLFKDVSGLDKLGMDGFISCQVMRVCFPTGLYMHVMGKGLWDAQAHFPTVVDQYFGDVFGKKEGPAVATYLRRITELFDPPFLRGEKPDQRSLETALRNFAQVEGLVGDFLPTIEKGTRSADNVRAAAWKIMREHAWHVCALARLHRAVHEGDAEKAVALCESYEQELYRRQPRIHHVLDGWAAVRVLRSVLSGHGIAV